MDKIKRVVMTCNQFPFDSRDKLWITHKRTILDGDKDAKRMKGVWQRRSAALLLAGCQRAFISPFCFIITSAASSQQSRWTGLRDEARLVRVHDSRWFLCCVCWLIT
jgi:hypothetical protein